MADDIFEDASDVSFEGDTQVAWRVYGTLEGETQKLILWDRLLRFVLNGKRPKKWEKDHIYAGISTTGGVASNSRYQWNYWGYDYEYDEDNDFKMSSLVVNSTKVAKSGYIALPLTWLGDGSHSVTVHVKPGGSTQRARIRIIEYSNNNQTIVSYSTNVSSTAGAEQDLTINFTMANTPDHQYILHLEQYIVDVPLEYSNFRAV